jgi:LysR family hydrogen peroxide-inducible transcriptional activator
MNIQSLKYLVALSKHKHFGKAANACFVSQPALSMRIAKLEDSLGIKLLERTNKSVMLTTHGMVIAERAKFILNQVQEVRDIAKLAKDPFCGELKIGVFPTLAPYLLPLVIPQLSKDYPKISFYLIEEQTTQLVEKLKEGKLDAALLAQPTPVKDFNHNKLFTEEFLLAIPAKHPLAKLKKVNYEHLHDNNLLLLDEGHCLREQALSICNNMRVMENQNFRATSLETLRQMVTAGVGITLMPRLACHAHDNIIYVPFAAPQPIRSVGLFWRTTSARQVLLEQVANKIKNILKKQKMVKVFE